MKHKCENCDRRNYCLLLHIEKLKGNSRTRHFLSYIIFIYPKNIMLIRKFNEIYFVNNIVKIIKAYFNTNIYISKLESPH